MAAVTEKYSFRSASIADLPIILELTLKGFIKACPHAKALHFTESAAKDFLRWIVECSLHCSYSVTVHEKATGKLVGYRLYSVSHRDHMKDFSPFDLDVESLPENVQILCRILDKQKSKIWDMFPHVNKVLRQEITFVDPLHQRQGIAQHFIRLLDVEALVDKGFAGIQSEATSYANQQMLDKLGYLMLSESEPHEYIWPDGTPIILPDNTTCVQLFFLPFC